MFRSTRSRAIAAAGLFLFLSACGFMQEEATGPALPDEPGFYALTTDSDDYIRLDGNQKWEIATWPERSDLQPYARFIVYHPALGMDPAPPSENVRLQKVAWVRSEIDRASPIRPPSGSKWVVTNLNELTVPTTVQPVEGRRDAVQIIPRNPLEPGLYSLQLRAANVRQNARMGVLWSTVDQAKYSSGNCVDRYITATTFYKPCAEQAEAMNQIQAEGLRVFLVTPESQTIGSQRTLVVKGVVVNTSDQTRKVPMLEGNIMDGGGTTLKRWLFQPDTRDLAPGKSASFRTEVPGPPQQTSKVTVNFTSATQVGSQ